MRYVLNFGFLHKECNLIRIVIYKYLIESLVYVIFRINLQYNINRVIFVKIFTVRLIYFYNEKAGQMLWKATLKWRVRS